MLPLETKHSGGKILPHSDLRGGVFLGETPRCNDYRQKQKIEMTERRGRRRKQLLDDLKEKKRYWKLKEEALDHTLWRARFGRGYGPVVRQTTE
jgi:hypothetical protein